MKLSEYLWLKEQEQSEMRKFGKGDRVNHTGRKENGTVLESGPKVVRVRFDTHTPSGKPSEGEFDENWFVTHPGWLKKISNTPPVTNGDNK